MSIKQYNRVQIMINAKHAPYIYGAVHIVAGDIDNQWWEKPYVISKRRANGSEVVYGTITRNLQKILSQMDRLTRFSSEARAKLDAAGLTSLIQDHSILPDAAVASETLDEQEDLIEDVLLDVSVNLRILSEIFPRQLSQSKVAVYDYDDRHVTSIELSGVADLLAHNRYIVVKNHYVVDLISDEKFLTDKPQMGLKINVAEYLGEAQEVIYGITVKDLVTKLWGAIKNLSASSNIKDIIFVTQSLYTLGGSVVGTGAQINEGPLKTILDRVALRDRDRVLSQSAKPEEVETTLEVAFSTPRFYLEPDLDQKQIRVQMPVNGQQRSLVMDYEEFFREVLATSGERSLLSTSRNLPWWQTSA